ncbi:DUF6440 family protein [Anaerorhabdus furcosa]|uniref:DUF6440 domain-containing protein n=1 Tax=Anaerorhabdus furcosa TaxID=118967 RepID=A0A1T4MQV5_9FIRM|nr:DUF6440 family protein [Anaerorhabdus furcosa]SJZ69165.1 hypothetical protein SAMN02745191_1355 [Anaerorhabdus furcosa]
MAMKRFKQVYSDGLGSYYTIIEDTVTGVQYLLFDKGGHDGGLAITPLLDAEGKPMINKTGHNMHKEEWI